MQNKVILRENQMVCMKEHLSIRVRVYDFNIIYD